MGCCSSQPPSPHVAPVTTTQPSSSPNSFPTPPQPQDSPHPPPVAAISTAQPSQPHSSSQSPPPPPLVAPLTSTQPSPSQNSSPTPSPPRQQSSPSPVTPVPATQPSSFTYVDDLAQNVRREVEKLHTEDVDLNGLIQHISLLLEFIKKKPSHQKRPTYQFWPSSSAGLLKLKELLTEGISAVKDIIPPGHSTDAKTVVVSLLKGIGQANWATASLLVVANILERFETVSANREDCLCLLEEMNKLAQHVKQLKERDDLKKGMQSLIKEATELILEASIMCCTQIEDSKFRRFFTTTVNKKELNKFQKKLDRMYTHMKNQMDICVYDAIDCLKVRSPRPREREYPEDAVGIENPLEEVTKLLDWGSEKKAIAIILHGFGGMGKTTLANAVFARSQWEDCKYSMIRMFHDRTSIPNIIELQKCILKDLMVGNEEEVMTDLRTFEDGQRQIGRLLEKEVAFIYIDHVLDSKGLEQLLPKDMSKAKKLRLLITARDANLIRVCKGCRVETKVYAMKGLQNTEAMSLLKNKMDLEVDTQKQLNPNQLNHIVDICGGIPTLLNLVAGFISCREDKQKAYSIVMEEKEKNWKGEIGKDIECYVFAYDNLDEMLKDPFLDICSFFNGWDWDAVANIVGESALDMLEKRALVTKDTNMIAKVHDVILEIGRQKTQGLRRSDITTASELQGFLDQEHIHKTKGIWFNETKDPLHIPASKLDLMYSSLRVLALGNSTKVEGKCNKTFEKMVFFQAKVSHLPFDVWKLKELRHFIYESVDLNLCQMPLNLRHMEFDGKLQSDATEISSTCLHKLHNLLILRLIRFAKLKTLPEDLGDRVTVLKELTLSYCQSIEELPRSISKLQFLRVLMLNSCSSFRQLPKDFGSLKSLQELNLAECISLEELPDRIEELESLRMLNLHGCTKLKKLPKGFGQLKCLAHLDLSFCTSLEELCTNFHFLSSLQTLSLNFCESLKELPPDFHCLASLQELSLEFCKTLEGKSMDSVVKTKSLLKVSIIGCSMLEERWKQIQEGGQSYPLPMQIE